MHIEQLQRELRTRFRDEPTTDLYERTKAAVAYVKQEFGIGPDALTQPEIRAVAKTLLEEETRSLAEELDALMVQRERLQRQIERKSDQIQEEKHQIFNALEAAIGEESVAAHASLHQVRLEMTDLTDILEEVIETAIITTLEKTTEIEETIEEITKEITYETLNEGPLENERIRRVIGAILHSAVNVSEAAPNQAEMILRGTLRGMRNGLIKSIRRLKKQLLFMPEELRLTETMQSDLPRSDVLFTQIIHDRLADCDHESRDLMEKLTKEMRFAELVEVSKETVELMREQFNQVLNRSQMLNSKTAVEAKKMGVTAWKSAKHALGGAISTAKEKMDKK